MLYAARPLAIDGFTCCSHGTLLEVFGDVVVCPDQLGLRRHRDMVPLNPIAVSESFLVAGHDLAGLTADLFAELTDCYDCLPEL